MGDNHAGQGRINTTCPYCGVGCGVSCAPGPERSILALGDETHPANFGKLCSKGTALGQTVGLEGRLLRPMVNGRVATWREATSFVARRFRETIARHGRDSVAFYVSGQLLTEDYYAANKLMKGYIRSGNIDTNSRLCMASAVVAHKQAFGADLVPGCYEDLDLADLVVFSGHNAAWTHPVLFARMDLARGRGQKHVVIDPRRTATADGCDLHLPLAPQTDVRLWNGLLADLIRRGAVDKVFVRDHVAGFDVVTEALDRDDQSPLAIANDCGLALTDLRAFFDLFAQTARTVSLFSMGANQSTQGVAKGLAIINAHLATGRIGKPGACPFSITGQPNAMGGREVGGMATTLAAHMDFTPAEQDRAARFWGTDAVASGPGLKAVDMFEAIRDGRIKAIWIMATNPAVSLPQAHRVREALDGCPLVVVSDCIADTDTAAFAHVKFPALAWGEKDGTVTNSERRISRQRPLFDAPGEAKADWRIVAEVASAMGHGEGFSWTSPAQVFREWARMTSYENDDRVLNLDGLVDLSLAAYDALSPVQWPVAHNRAGTPRLFTDGRFQTPSAKANMIPLTPQPLASLLSAAFPFSLNSGRGRDQWHTMTRTGLSADLCRHAPEPYVDIHPDDARSVGLSEGDLTRIQTAQGEAVALARLTERQRRGDLFMLMHFSDAFAPSGRVNALVGSQVDALSGQPEFKHTPARVKPYREAWRGFLITRTATNPPPGLDLVWRRIPQEDCHLHEFAGRGDQPERELLQRRLSKPLRGQVLAYEDPAFGSRREAWVSDNRLEAVLFVTAHGRLPPRGWLADLFTQGHLSSVARANLLFGGPSGAQPNLGRLVCACNRVHMARITTAIAGGADTAEAIGAATGAGTNCGSCRRELIAALATQVAEARKEDRNAA